MNSISPFILASFYGVFFIVSTLIIIYLIFRRIKIKREETFEKRNN